MKPDLPECSKSFSSSTIAVAIPSFHSLNNFQLSFCQEASWKQRATCAPTLFKKKKKYFVDLTENTERIVLIPLLNKQVYTRNLIQRCFKRFLSFTITVSISFPRSVSFHFSHPSIFFISLLSLPSRKKKIPHQIVFFNFN
jgi:hypothetical protein